MPSPSQVVTHLIDSQVLRGNPLGDPATRRLAVYLPQGYDDEAARYPTVYLLPGFTGRGYFMLNDSAFDEPIQERLDRLLAAGVIRPLIAVLVDGFTRYGGSQYLNSGAVGRYEDHLVDEIVPVVDRTFRTKAEPGYRAIAGKSSGGYGALRLAMRRPGLFGAVACHSGDLYFDYCYPPDFVKFINAAARNKIESDASLADFLTNFQPKMQPKPPAFFDLLHMAAMAACYSPNPASPCGFDLPFEWYTGRLRPTVWQRWLANDPVTMLDTPAYAAALRGLKLLYLDCGNHDEYALHLGARIFSQRLTELNIPHHYEEFEGGHQQTQFRYDVSLQVISRVFAF
jgi:enterochelin esterase family protein